MRLSVVSRTSVSRRSLKLGIMAASLMCFGLQTGWANQETEAERERQRELFPKAEYAAKRGRLPEYQQLLRKLGDYPLEPYLELLRLKRVGYLANESRVLEFLEQYEGSPLDWQLRQPWLDYLASEDERARFLRDFRHPGSIKHRCLYFLYNYEQDELPEPAFKKAMKQLWLTGSSLPDECDLPLKQWSELGGRTEMAVWQRLQLAAEGGQHTLIPYLKGLLPDAKHYLADLYYEMRRDPSRISVLTKFSGEFPSHEAQIAAYALGRLIWRDPDLALKVYPQATDKFPFSAVQLADLAQTFALALSNKNHPQAYVWQQQVPVTDASESVLQWRLASYLRQGDFASVLHLTQQLPAVVMQGNQWRYWQARALAETGNELRAQQIYQALAQERHYYGFLAAAHLQVNVNLSRQPLVYEPEQLERIRQMPAAKRAYEFLQLDRGLPARREWNYLLSTLSAPDQQLAAVVASGWQWHDQAIFGLAAIGHFDAVQLRFPLAYYELMLSAANVARIDETWAFAIARRESAFRADAYSPAGARGVMQILPSTARYIDSSADNAQQLYNPTHNIRLGTRYLGDLQQRLNGNKVLATAAYNAGIYRVKEWLPNESQALDVWVETIPYQETRDYVKNVLAYEQIYSMLLNRKTNLFAPLVDMTIVNPEDE